MSNLNICVVGAGVVGLTTALELQGEFRNATITLLSDNFNKQTTSFVAPALFFPGHTFQAAAENLKKDCSRELFCSSHKYWNDLVLNNDGPKVGVSQVSGYLFSNISPNAVRNAYLEELIPGFRLLSSSELELFNGGWKFGSSLTTLVIENGIYLPWATDRFLKQNGQVSVQKLVSFAELVGKYDVVVNCTGTGAKYLCNDAILTPV